jgi:hypothetical protein
VDWEQAKYDEYMDQIRRSIEKRFGAGQLIARRPSPRAKSCRRSWATSGTRTTRPIEIFYYSAQNGSNVFRTLSVHYKSN